MFLTQIHTYWLVFVPALQICLAKSGNIVGAETDDLTVVKLISCLDSNGSNSSSVFVKRNATNKNYNDLNYQWNQRIPEIHPLGYLVPKSAKDVQNAIRCGQQLNIQMFAKSGGYSYEKYSFGNQNSVVVDLRKLSGIRINKPAKTATIGGGALVGHIYWKLWRNGKFGLPLPSCTSIGIGGSTLGGGYSLWSTRYGMTLDNIVEMDVVVANGDVLRVSEENLSDLFWALRGGGLGNFGIVTKFKFKIFDASDLNVTHIQFSYNTGQFYEVFDAFQNWNYAERYGTAYVGLRIDVNGCNVHVIDVGLDVDDIQNVIKGFPVSNLTPVEVKSMKYIDLSVATAFPAAKYGSDLRKVTQMDLSKRSYRAKSYYSKKLLNSGEIDVLKSVLGHIPEGIFIQFGSHGGAINRILKNATSFVHRDSLYLIQLGIRSSANEKGRIVQNQWLDMFENAVKILDSGESYQNYADGELKQRYMGRYYGENSMRLMSVKSEVDPTNYFRYAQSIPISGN